MKRVLLVLVLGLVACDCVDEPSSYLPPPRPGATAPFEFTPPAGLTKLRIGLVPYIDPAEMRVTHAPLAAYLSAQLKVPVEIVVGDNYDDVGSRLGRGELDLAEFSPYAYVRAERHLKLRPLTTAISDGSETAAGYILVRQDSPMRTLDDLKGASFGFVDRASTSGYLFPMKMLKDRGVVLSRAEFLGNHEAVLLAVLSGQVEAGSTFQGSMAALKRSKNIDPLSFRIIAKTPRTPRDLFCVRADLAAEVGDAVVKVLTQLSARDGKGRAILGPLNMNGFFPANDRLYDGVRAAATALGEIEP